MNITKEIEKAIMGTKHTVARLEVKYNSLDEKLDKALEFASKGHMAPLWFLVYALVVGVITWHIRGWFI